MYLKKLELSGFKSFAKQTILEFPSAITAIVGPNGSGKSNIKESIQWVLGEQSMKSLRGKKGEDLIWNGSAQVPRMGKASVELLFDNKNGKIPIEFEEVSLERKIFRDGLNEYYINNSPVRLKDMVELMARIGLGETKHNIIGQGEVDRILLSSPRDRREMLEEALGLRVYQLKKNESERKLEATRNNMTQVEALLREIAPHLKFLHLQAKKAQARESVEGELNHLQKIYFVKERGEIDEEKKRLADRRSPFLEKQKKVQEAIAKLNSDIVEAEKEFSTKSAKSEDEKKLMELDSRRREIERELGRLEGRLEVEKEKANQPKLRTVDTRYIQEEIRVVLSEIKSFIEEEDRIDDLKSNLRILVEDLEKLLGRIEKGVVEEKNNDAGRIIKDIEKTIKSLQAELSEVGKEVEKFQNLRREEREEYRNWQMGIRELDSLLRTKQDEERDITVEIQRFKFEDERLGLREEVLMKEVDESGIKKEELEPNIMDGYETIPNEDLKRKIERIRGKLEEIGGIDDAVIKEYQDTEARHSFLTGELEDLKQASASLKELIKELDKHVKDEFKEGFSKIKEEFNNYFRIIFGGGKGILQLIKSRKLKKDELEDLDISSEDQGDDENEGIEISVDLPRKRIKGLTMLSGGERALASVALIFSITAVSPPPFLILDETDAALDEANSKKYALILKELSKRTQLILVTHNRETMKCASVLYGVTMGDDGVTKLLSLRLEEAEVYTNR